MKLKPRELKWPAQGHTTYNAEKDLPSSSLTADYMLFTTLCCNHIIITPSPFGDAQRWSDLPKTHGYQRVEPKFKAISSLFSLHDDGCSVWKFGGKECPSLREEKWYGVLESGFDSFDFLPLGTPSKAWPLLWTCPSHHFVRSRDLALVMFAPHLLN